MAYQTLEGSLILKPSLYKDSSGIGCLNIHETHVTANIGCLKIDGTHVTANNSTNNNVTFFIVSDLIL